MSSIMDGFEPKHFLSSAKFIIENEKQRKVQESFKKTGSKKGVN